MLTAREIKLNQLLLHEWESKHDVNDAVEKAIENFGDHSKSFAQSWFENEANVQASQAIVEQASNVKLIPDELQSINAQALIYQTKLNNMSNQFSTTDGYFLYSITWESNELQRVFKVLNLSNGETE